MKYIILAQEEFIRNLILQIIKEIPKF